LAVRGSTGDDKSLLYLQEPGKDGLTDVQLTCSRDQLQAGFATLH